jgi:hypothetical protein
MKRRNFGESREFSTRNWPVVALLGFTIALTGCSAHAKQVALQPAGSAPSEQSPDGAPLPGPEAKVQISYSKTNDFLATLSVTKYGGASTLTTAPAGANDTASVVRFEGGIPVWRINVESGMFSEMPIGFSSKTYAVSEVKYGKVPAHFVQSIPDLEPPEPLEPGHFYIFAVTRKSGSISYEAVKVDSDGSLQAYEADPRAGSSFRLCCNVSSGFTETPPPSAFDSSLSPLEAPGP